METATKIRESLKEMFRHNTLSARQAALKDVMNSNIEKSVRVCEHDLKIMDYLNEAEIQGAEIDDNSEIDMVLKSLLKTSKAF